MLGLVLHKRRVELRVLTLRGSSDLLSYPETYTTAGAMPVAGTPREGDSSTVTLH